MTQPALSPEERKAKKAAYDRDRYEADKEKRISAVRNWRLANADKDFNMRKARREANKERDAAIKKAWYGANKERVALRNKVRHEANPHVAVTKSRIRRDDVARQCPIWADQQKIAEIYRDAAEFRAAGLNVHVDHIVPLKAKLACGLHVHRNLTIKLAEWNDSKGNKYDPMEPPQ